MRAAAEHQEFVDLPTAARRLGVNRLTANALVEDRERALAAGCDDFDTKPVELPRLLEKIKTQLGTTDRTG